MSTVEQFDPRSIDKLRGDNGVVDGGSDGVGGNKQTEVTGDQVAVTKDSSTNLDPFLLNLLSKTAVVGLSYFDVNGELLQQRQLGGSIVRVTPEDGITLRFIDGKTEFNLPSDTRCWFGAPKGNYRFSDIDGSIENPDFLVTWNIFKTQDKTKPEGEHEWWEWEPNTIAPAVG